MERKKAQLVLDEKAILGEGPAWDEKTGCLFWVDIQGEKVHIYNPKTNHDRKINVGEPIGAVVPREKGDAILALENGFAYLDLENENIEYMSRVEGDNSDTRFNDGKCDPAGRFWAGTMSKAESQAIGSLYYLDTDHKVRKMVENVTTSNGLAWSPDNNTFYYIDTPTQKVVAFDYDLGTGNIKNQKIVIDFAEEKGKPDGMNIDEEGRLWIAHWQGYQVSCWNPETGNKLIKVEVPVERVTSCCFGGEDLKELYITTARTGVNSDELKKQPHAGCLFKVETEVKGCKTYQFQG